MRSHRRPAGKRGVRGVVGVAVMLVTVAAGGFYVGQMVQLGGLHLPAAAGVGGDPTAAAAEGPRRLGPEEQAAGRSGARAAVPHSLSGPVLEATGGYGEQELHELPFQVLSWHPRAFLYPNFLSAAECEAVIALAQRQMAPSGLALTKEDMATNRDTKNIRTSQGTFLSSAQDKGGVLRAIEKRIAELVGVTVDHGEAFNVLRYEHGQHYFSHHDYFDPKLYGNQGTQGNRVATVLLYLTDVEQGGETVLPLASKGPDQGWRDRLAMKDIFQRCDLGLRVKPRKGQALLFYSAKPDGSLDEQSLHGGCPVEAGTKWVATKWIRAHGTVEDR